MIDLKATDFRQKRLFSFRDVIGTSPLRDEELVCKEI
jgi:hypothetical protein